MGFWVWDLGIRGWGLGGWGLGFRVWGLEGLGIGCIVPMYWTPCSESIHSPATGLSIPGRNVLYVSYRAQKHCMYRSGPEHIVSGLILLYAGRDLGHVGAQPFALNESILLRLNVMYRAYMFYTRLKCVICMILGRNRSYVRYRAYIYYTREATWDT